MGRHIINIIKEIQAINLRVAGHRRDVREELGRGKEEEVI